MPAVVDLPEVRYHWFQLPDVDGGNAGLLTVSPDLDAVLWVRWHLQPEPMTRQLILTTASGDAVVADLPAEEGGRCGSPQDSKSATISSPAFITTPSTRSS